MNKMKYPQMFYVFAMFNIITPYVTGPLISLNSKRMKSWGWLPLDTDDEKSGFSANELRFAS